MNGNLQRELLGEWVDKGYWLKEYDDHILTVGYKDKEVAAFSQIGALPELLRDVCQRHEAKLRKPAEVKQ